MPPYRAFAMPRTPAPICSDCGATMIRQEARIRPDGLKPGSRTANGQNASRLSRTRVGWLCIAPGCNHTIRTYFMPPITPP